MVADYRRDHGIQNPLVTIDWTGVYCAGEVESPLLKDIDARRTSACARFSVRIGVRPVGRGGALAVPIAESMTLYLFRTLVLPERTIAGLPHADGRCASNRGHHGDQTADRDEASIRS